MLTVKSFFLQIKTMIIPQVGFVFAANGQHIFGPLKTKGKIQTRKQRDRDTGKKGSAGTASADEVGET